MPHFFKLKIHILKHHLLVITIQDITGERFLHGKERSGLREGSSAASFFPQGWNFFPAGLELFSRRD